MFVMNVKRKNLTKNFKETKWQFQREEIQKQERQKEELIIKLD